MTYVPPKTMKTQNAATQPAAPSHPAPTPAQVAELQASLGEARVGVTNAWAAFHTMIQNKRLDKNKSNLEKDAERKTVDTLFNAAKDLDGINPGEGVMILAGLALRELLVMRDRLNETEYLALVTKKDLGELKAESKQEVKTDVASETSKQ
jgi:hypothetical protein